MRVRASSTHTVLTPVLVPGDRLARGVLDWVVSGVDGDVRRRAGAFELKLSMRIWARKRAEGTAECPDVVRNRSGAMWMVVARCMRVVWVLQCAARQRAASWLLHVIVRLGISGVTVTNAEYLLKKRTSGGRKPTRTPFQLLGARPRGPSISVMVLPVFFIFD